MAAGERAAVVDIVSPPRSGGGSNSLPGGDCKFRLIRLGYDIPEVLDTAQIAATLRLSIGLLLRRLRQIPTSDELTLSESAALARLDRGGPATAAALARLEQISPQSMGATLAALEAVAWSGGPRTPEMAGG